MVLGIEIAMFIMGLIALVKGKLTLTKSKVVEGLGARLLGLVLLLPIPLSIGVAIVWGIVLNVNNNSGQVVMPSQGGLIGAEFGIIAVCAAIAFGIGAFIAKPPAPTKSKSRTSLSVAAEADE